MLAAIGCAHPKTPEAPCERGAMIVYDLSRESWMERACHIANRDLSPEEGLAFLGDPEGRACEGE